jgi:F-type H+-transporting ATPase subunit delta
MKPKNLKIAQPYAQAFIELATKESLPTIIKDLQFLSFNLEQSKEMQKFLSNPVIKLEAKKNFLKSTFGKKIEKVTLQFLLVICDRQKLSYLESIIERALELSYKVSSIELVKVKASVSLTNSQEDALISKLKSMTQADQIKLSVQIDPKLLGGFSIQVGSKIIDTSIQGQLKRMAIHLGVSLI